MGVDMKEIEIRAKSIEEAIEEAVKRFQLPREAIKVVKTYNSYDDTLDGAEPLEGFAEKHTKG